MLPGYVWDSGEDPRAGTELPRSVSINLQTAEVWIVSRGHGTCPLELGRNGEAMYYAGGMNANSIQAVNWFDGSPRQLEGGTFWPQLAPTIHGFRGNGPSSIVTFINGLEYPAIPASTPATSGGMIGKDTSFNGIYPFAGDVYRVLIYSANLSSANRVHLLTYLRDRYEVEPYDAQVIFDGSSLEAGYNSVENRILNGWSGGDHTYGYPWHIAHTRRNWKCLNHGICGETIKHLHDHAAAAIDPYFDVALGENIIVLGSPTNDLLFGANLADVEDVYMQYVADRQAVGFKVLAQLMPDRANFSAGQRADMDIFNQRLVAGMYGVDKVGLLPASLSGFSWWKTNPSKADSDLTHLSRFGYQDWAAATLTALDSFFGLPIGMNHRLLKPF